MGERRTRGHSLLLAASLAAMGILLYSGTLGAGAIWDDRYFVFGDAFVSRCENLLAALGPRSSQGVVQIHNAARPVWLASVLVDTCLYRGRVPGYRMTSLLWHSADGLLLAAAAALWLSDPWAPALAAALFLAHPVHAEAVNIVTFRADLLCLAFMLLALLLHAQANEAEGRALAWRTAAAASFAMALLSKEMAATFPVIVWMFESLRRAPRVERRQRILRCLPFAAVLLAFLAFRIPRGSYPTQGGRDLMGATRSELPAWPQGRARAQASRRGPEPLKVLLDDPPGVEPYLGRSARRAAATAMIFGDYLRLLAWPTRLQGDYAPPTDARWSRAGPWTAALAWTGLLALGFRLRRSLPAAAFGLAWLAITLVPVSGLIPLGNWEAERYLLVPSAGACLAAAAAFAYARQSRRWSKPAAVAACVATAALAARTVWRNRDFRDDRAFFAATVAADPSIARAHQNLGASLHEAGDDAGAERELRRAVDLWPTAASPRLCLADLLLEIGRAREARAELDAGLALSPDNPYLHRQLAVWDGNEGRARDALRHWHAVLHFDPAYWQAQLALGTLLLDQGRADRAAEYLRAALMLTRWRSEAAFAALDAAYRRAGHVEKARRLEAAGVKLLPRQYPMGAPGFEDDCEADARRLCPGKMGGKLAACLATRIAETQPQCRKLLAPLLRPCRHEVDVLCGTIPLGLGLIANCLTYNKAKLSPACSDALPAFR